MSIINFDSTSFLQAGQILRSLVNRHCCDSLLLFSVSSSLLSFCVLLPQRSYSEELKASRLNAILVKI
jgi:hypothetical protein